MRYFNKKQVRVFFILLIVMTLSLAASPPPFIRITDILATSQPVQPIQQYIGIEMRTVLFAPETMELPVFSTDNDGVIVLVPERDLPKLVENSLGLRLQIQYTSNVFMANENKRLGYEFVSRETIRANTPINLRPPGKSEAYVHVWTRQVVPQTMSIQTNPVRVPPKSHLDFAVGLQNDWRIPRGSKVRFKLVANTDTSKTLLYDEIIRRHEPWEPIRWRRRSLDLNNIAGETVSLSFITEQISDEQEMLYAFPLWGSPILYSENSNPNEDKTNIIMIALDTLRADHLGCYGYKRNTSPNIDAFAATNITFDNAFASAPWTTPSFASIFTGRLPAVHQAGVFQKNLILDSKYATLSEYARNTGRLTAAFTEGIAVRAQLGFSRGFDSYSDGDSPLSHKTGTAEASFRVAAAWLETYGHLPFFLFVHSYEPHAYYNAPDPWNLMFADPAYSGDTGGDPEGATTAADKQHMRDQYDGSIAYADHWVGWFLDQVKQAGLFENTIIVFFSDHGEAFWEHGYCGHLSTLYDEVLHVPVILSLPSAMKCSKRIKQQIGSADIFATLLELLNIPAENNLDSYSLLPLINTTIQSNSYSRNYVSSELRYVAVEETEQSNGPAPIEHLRRSLRNKTHKYIVTKEPVIIHPDASQDPADAETEELYDLVADPLEKTNLSGTEVDKTILWRKRFHDFFAGFGIDITTISPEASSDSSGINQENLEALKTLGYL